MANRRIIQSNESEESVRQKAFNQNIKNFADYGQKAIESNRAAEKTKRQIALEEKAERMNNLSNALTLSEKSGKLVTSEDVKRFKETGAFEEQLKEGEFGPAAPSGLDSIIGGISEKQKAAKMRKEGREDIDYGQKVYTNKENALPFRKRQEAEKMRLAAELKAKTDRSSSQNRPKDNEFKAGGFARRARMAERDLGELRTDVGTDVTDIFSDYVPDMFKGEEKKLYEQAKNNFISAVLRKESGAAISDEEYARENAKYYPSVNDGPDVIKQKARAREQAMQNLEAEGARALPFISQVGRDSRPQMGRQLNDNSSVPLINDAQASGDQEMKVQKYNRLQELRRKAQQ